MTLHHDPADFPRDGRSAAPGPAGSAPARGGAHRGRGAPSAPTGAHDPSASAPRPGSRPLESRGQPITTIAPAHAPIGSASDGPHRGAAPPLSFAGLVSLHRRSLVVCVLAGLAAGLGIGYASPVEYTAQGQLLAGATSVSAAAVPSFAQAGQSLAQTYSRVFSGDQVQKELAAAGFDSATETATASPVPNSSVVLIETRAPTAEQALRAANTGITALQSTVAGLLDNSASIARTREALRVAYEQQAEAEAARNALEVKKVKPAAAVYVTATADLGAAQASVGAARQLLADQVTSSVQANGVQPLTSAGITSTTSSKRYQFWGAIGLVAGLALWTAIAFLRSQPLRRRPPSRRTAA